MAIYKNREVSILSYEDGSSQSQVSVYNKDLNDRQIVSADELILSDDEFSQYVVKRQQDKLDSLKKDRAEQTKAQKSDKSDKSDVKDKNK